MEETVAPIDYPRDLTFEKVWAMFQEAKQQTPCPTLKIQIP